MVKKGQFIKTIIMVIASALTLVAVTFAWFSTPKENAVPMIETGVGSDLLMVDFYEEDKGGEYKLLSDDITLSECVAGNYNKYKIVVRTNTPDKLKINFGIENLPVNMNKDLKNSVCVKYEIKSTVKGRNGVIREDKVISYSNGYVPLSTLNNGSMVKALSLSNYQKGQNDTFIIYYEIGLSGDSPSTIEGMTSSLGDVKVTAQRIG